MSILKRPILSEKSMKHTEDVNPVYVFEVAMDASKPQIENAITKGYSVEVEDVRTLVVRGKRSTRNTKRGVSHGKASNYKKAFVTLKQGFSIDFYSNI